MIAVTASFLCSALLGLRLTFIGFTAFMMAASFAVLLMQGVLAGVLALLAMQLGYVAGVMLRAVRTEGPALRRAALR